MTNINNRVRFALFLVIFLPFFISKSFSQCPPFPTLTLTSITDKVTFDDFSEVAGGKTINAVYVNVTALGAACAWDLYVDDAVITSLNPYSTQGAALPLTNINIRANNICETPDQDYGFGSPPCAALADPTRICESFNNPLVVGGDNYIIGTSPPAASDDGILLQNAGACAAVENINDPGNFTTNPNTHRFRIDLQVIPGIVPVITPGFYTLDISFAIIDDDRVGAPTILTYTLQIDIQPILQMNMKSEGQLDFVFSDVKDYLGGITRYGATSLQVSSTMNWDLIALATSTENESTAGGNAFWDQNINYSATSGSNQIPLYVLELHQIPDNPLASGAGIDYSPAFPAVPYACSNNFIEVANQAGGSVAFFLNPCNGAQGDKTVAGNWDGGGGGTFIGPGSFTPDLVIPVAEWDPADFRYVFDYRLVPGLPATFNGAMATFVRPGSYSMQVRYLLFEDQ